MEQSLFRSFFFKKRDGTVKLKTVVLKHGSTSFHLLRDCVSVDEVTALFILEHEGLYLKIQDNGMWNESYADNDGNF